MWSILLFFSLCSALEGCPCLDPDSVDFVRFLKIHASALRNRKYTDKQQLKGTPSKWMKLRGNSVRKYHAVETLSRAKYHSHRILAYVRDVLNTPRGSAKGLQMPPKQVSFSPVCSSTFTMQVISPWDT